MKGQAMRLFSLLALALAATAAQAQDALPIALVNIDRIYKTYKPLQDKLAPIKAGAQEMEKKAQLRQIELETVVTQLRKSQPGSPESNRLQQQAAKLQTELQQFVAKERDALQKQEAAVLLDMYRQVDDEVKKYAKAKGLKLVIRQQDSSLDENQSLQAILAALNRGIIYEEGLDITDDILKALDARNSSAEKKDR
jgi:Skp family chaperone for outer membrane proteins